MPRTKTERLLFPRVPAWRCFARAAFGADGVLEAEAGHGAGGPRPVPERAAAREARVEVSRVFGGDRRVDPLDPVARPRDRPGGGQQQVAQGGLGGVGVRLAGGARGGGGADGAAEPEAAPAPVLGAADQAGGQGVALDVAGGQEEVAVGLDREALEA